MINSILFLFSCLKTLLFLRIYQQAHYQIRRYIVFFLKNFIYINLLILITYIIAIIGKEYIFWIFFSIYSLVYALLFYLKGKVKLKFTHRIIRLTVVIIIFYICIFHIKQIEVSSIIFLLCEFSIIPLLLFMNLIEYLLSLKYIKKAKNKINSYMGTRIAITGSFGKTTTKHFLQQLLEENYSVKSSNKSYNTILGTAKFMNSINPDSYEYLVFEMGATKTHDIEKLMNLVKPKVGILTEVGYMHIDSFKSIQKILEEKVKVIEMLDEDGLGIVNFENSLIRNYKFKTKAKVISYGFNYGDYQARNIESYNRDGLKFDLYNQNQYITTIYTNFIGEHNVLNLLSGLAFMLYNNMALYEKRIRLFKNHEHRQEIKKYGNHTIIDDAFSSNLKGFLSAINSLSKHEGVKYLITPGIVEIKKHRKEIYKNLAEEISKVVDIVILVGYYETRYFYLELKKYNLNIFVVKNFSDGYLLYLKSRKDNEYSTLLIENDLPDIYRVGF